jgi:hypothetical protein
VSRTDLWNLKLFGYSIVHRIVFPADQLKGVSAAGSSSQAQILDGFTSVEILSVKDSARLYAVLTTLNSSKLELVTSHFLASVRLNMPFNKVTVQMTAELTIKGDVEEVEISSSAALKMKDNVNSGRVRSSGNI